MYVCVCRAVTEQQIHDAARGGATTLTDLRRQLGVSSECGQCAADARKCLAVAIENLRRAAKERGDNASASHLHGVDIAQTPGNHAADGRHYRKLSGRFRRNLGAYRRRADRRATFGHR